MPGGPWSRRPDRLRPRLSSSGCSRGSWMVSRISFFTSCSPPTSCQDTEGIWGVDEWLGKCKEGEPVCPSKDWESHLGCSHSLGVSCLQLI